MLELACIHHQSSWRHITWPCQRPFVPCSLFPLQKSARIILHLLCTALVSLQNLYQTFFMDWYDSCNAQFFVYSNLSHSGYTSCQIQQPAGIHTDNVSMKAWSGCPNPLQTSLSSVLMQSCCAAVTHMQIATNYNIYDLYMIFLQVYKAKRVNTAGQLIEGSTYYWTITWNKLIARTVQNR